MTAAMIQQIQPISAEKLNLLKVGELAKQTGKTVRAVHLYEELGLLAPAVRSKGGFRLYHPRAAVRSRLDLRSCRTSGSR